jgi:hypothetical protein
VSRSCQVKSFTKSPLSLLVLTKVKYSLPTVHDRGRGYSNSFKASAEGYTLPTRFDTSAGRNPRFDIHKVCEVQIIKQNLSLAHPSIGSFPRARDTELSAPAPLVLPIPETGLVRTLGQEVSAHGVLP